MKPGSAAKLGAGRTARARSPASRSLLDVRGHRGRGSEGADQGTRSLRDARLVHQFQQFITQHIEPRFFGGRLFHDDHEIQTAWQVVLVPPEDLAQTPFPSVPPDGVADLAAYSKAESRAVQRVLRGVDDQARACRSLSATADPFELRSFPEPFGRGKAFVQGGQNVRSLPVARRGQALATARAATAQDFTSATRLLAGAETVGASALLLAGLVGSLRHRFTWFSRSLYAPSSIVPPTVFSRDRRAR